MRIESKIFEEEPAKPGYQGGPEITEGGDRKTVIGTVPSETSKPSTKPTPKTGFDRI